MSLYKAVIGYTYEGQKMANILYYRDAGSTILLDAVLAQQQLADAIRENVVLGGVIGQTRLADILPNECFLDEVRVQRISATTFKPETNSPSVSNIGLPSLYGDDAQSPMICAIMQLVCPASTLAPTDYTPKGGYLAIGPIAKTATDKNGVLTQTQQGYFNNFGAALVQTLDMGGGYLAKPIRIGRGKNSLGFTVNGFNDIQNASVRAKSSFRRSRGGE